MAQCVFLHHHHHRRRRHDEDELAEAITDPDIGLAYSYGPPLAW